MDESFEIIPVEESFEEVVTMHSCDVCCFSTKYKSNLNRHRLRHTKNNIQIPVSNTKAAESNTTKHICDQCGKAYHSRYGLNVHIKIKHLKQFRFICAVCKKGFHQLWNFRGHLSSHHAAIREKCSKCGKIFHYKASLVLHMRQCKDTDENNNGAFACSVCKAKLKSKKNLTDHLRGAHGGHQCRCDICGKTFKWRSSLSYHKRNVKH